MRNSFYIIIVFILLLSSCTNRHEDKTEQSHIRIATLKGPSSMGMIRLIDSISRKEDSDISIDILDEPIQVRKMMIEGSADIAVLPTTMAAILYNKGLEYKLTAIPVWGTLYLFGSDTGIVNWADLRGREINVMARGMTPDVLFRFLLEKNGLNPENDVILDYRFPTHADLANAVAAGQAELAVISEPMVSLVMKRNREVNAIFDLNSEWGKIQGVPLAQTALMVKSSFLRDDPRLAGSIITAYERSVDWVNNFPDSAAGLIVKYGILPDYEVAYNSIPRSNMRFVRAAEISEDIENYLSVFYSMNPDIIGGRIPDEDFIF